MGDFRMTIEAAGGHGCDRNAKHGDEVRGCGQETCPDCIFARFVSELQRAGMRPTRATFHHWPADMAAHDFEQPTPDPASRKCRRCGQTYAQVLVPDEEAHGPGCSGSAVLRPCRMYDAAHEVVDDYSERDVKYPTGAFRRATGVRIKGAF